VNSNSENETIANDRGISFGPFLIHENNEADLEMEQNANKSSNEFSFTKINVFSTQYPYKIDEKVNEIYPFLSPLVSSALFQKKSGNLIVFGDKESDRDFLPNYLKIFQSAIRELFFQVNQHKNTNSEYPHSIFDLKLSFYEQKNDEKFIKISPKKLSKLKSYSNLGLSTDYLNEEEEEEMKISHNKIVKPKSFSSILFSPQNPEKNGKNDKNCLKTLVNPSINYSTDRLFTKIYSNNDESDRNNDKKVDKSAKQMSTKKSNLINNSNSPTTVTASASPILLSTNLAKPESSVACSVLEGEVEFFFNYFLSQAIDSMFEFYLHTIVFIFLYLYCSNFFCI
jgi:hypothetical protein